MGVIFGGDICHPKMSPPSPSNVTTSHLEIQSQSHKVTSEGDGSDIFGQEIYGGVPIEYDNVTIEEWLPKLRYQTLGINIEPSFSINKFQRFDFGFDFNEYSKQYLTWSNMYDYKEEEVEDELIDIKGTDNLI